MEYSIINLTHVMEYFIINLTYVMEYVISLNRKMKCRFVRGI